MLLGNHHKSEDLAEEDNLEVLNISNVSATGEVVLNDEKLLELVQFYPFLYNQRVKPYQDPDYEEWAWARIAASFNETYENSKPESPFTVAILKHRWKLLQPIILSLSNSYDINAIPVSLRQHVVKLSVQMGSKLTGQTVKTDTSVQNVLRCNIPMVERLPLETRKSMENDFMKLILSEEIESKSTIKSYAVSENSVEQEVKRVLTDMFLVHILDCDQDNDSNDVQIVDSEAVALNGDSSVLENATPLNSMKPMIYSTKEVNVRSDSDHSSPNPIMIKEAKIEALLVPLDRSKWVPLNQAHHFVRKCVVRVKRTPPSPDDIPLSIIKRERYW